MSASVSTRCSVFEQTSNRSSGSPRRTCCSPRRTGFGLAKAGFRGGPQELRPQVVGEDGGDPLESLGDSPSNDTPTTLKSIISDRVEHWITAAASATLPNGKRRIGTV